MHTSRHGGVVANIVFSVFVQLFLLMGCRSLGRAFRSICFFCTEMEELQELAMIPLNTIVKKSA